MDRGASRCRAEAGSGAGYGLQPAGTSELRPNNHYSIESPRLLMWLKFRLCVINPHRFVASISKRVEEGEQTSSRDSVQTQRFILKHETLR